MTTLLWLLVVPVVWLFLLPRRLLAVLRGHPGLSAGVLALVLLGIWGTLQLLPSAPTETLVSYAEGDAALRLMLE